MEALGVAIAVNAGAALVYSARVMDAYTAKMAENNCFLSWPLVFPINKVARLESL